MSAIMTGATVFVAIGTMGLAGATICLAVEVNKTRKEEQSWRKEEREWRRRDDAVKGLEAFIGRYTQPGESPEVLEGGVNLNRYGTRLEINRFGAMLSSNEIGHFYGGYLEIHDNELYMEMGMSQEKDEQKRTFSIAVLSRNEIAEHGRSIAIATGGVARPKADRWNAEWKLDLREWREQEWKTVSTVWLEKHSETVPKRRFKTRAGSGQDLEG